MRKNDYDIITNSIEKALKEASKWNTKTDIPAIELSIKNAVSAASNVNKFKVNVYQVEEKPVRFWYVYMSWLDDIGNTYNYARTFNEEYL